MNEENAAVETQEQTEVDTAEKLFGEASLEETSKAESVKEDEVEETDVKEDEGSENEASSEEENLTYEKEMGLSEEQFNDILSFGKESNMSNDMMKELVKREAKIMNGYQEAQEERHLETVSKWEQEVISDPNIGGENFEQTKELAQSVMQRFASQELLEGLTQSGLGNHPELVKFVVNIGKAMSDDSLRTGGSPVARERSIEEIFYGNE